MSSSFGAPQPMVVHLFSIFRQIAAGELRIPAFQREFVWQERQVLDLLRSVRDQFPIGSILLWNVDHKMLEIAGHQMTSFPNVPEKYPTSYILDGMQRLSTLYGAFHFVDGDPEVFNVHYDLRQQRFVPGSDVDLISAESCVPLPSLISPRRILEHQSRLAQLPDGDILLDELLETQAAFQDYMIPIVKIQGTDIERIVGIFERINSTGTRLDTVDFMRAITWDQNFDLNTFLDRVQYKLVQDGVEIYDETIIKCVGLMLGVPPSSDDLLSLRNQSPKELSDAFERFPDLFKGVSRFLEDRFNIENMSFVPYEGQLLVLFEAIALGSLQTEREFAALEKWFWASGFNESLRGKADHYVVRATQNLEGLLAGRIRGLEPRLRISDADFLTRRLIKGKALTGAFAAMFAKRGAQSLLTGEPIPKSAYMTVGNLDAFVTIFSNDELRVAGIDAGPSPRIFPNVVLANPAEKMNVANGRFREIILELAMKGDGSVLRSQFIDPDAIEYLEQGDLPRFLKSRSMSYWAFADSLVGSDTLL